MKTFLIKNGNVFFKSKIQKLDLLIKNNRIIKIKKNINDSCENIINAEGLTIIPGLIDVHVHLRQPGFEYKETIGSGTMAAAAGGFTTICCMPNVNPPLDNVKELKKQQEIIKHQALINVLPYSAITIGRTGHGKLVDFAKNKKYCFAFSDDGSGVCDEVLMDEAMKKISAIDSHIVAHCEDLKLVNGGCIHDGKYAAKNKLKVINSESEYLQIARDVKLALKNKCKYHVCHISTKEGVQIIKKAKSPLITCEVTPHHLLLNENNLKDSGDFKMNPPLRSALDQNALIDGIKNKVIKIIASDHAPHSKQEKSKGLKNSAFGVSSIEFSFPLLYTNLVLKKIIDFKTLIDLMSLNTNKIFKIKSNEIRVNNHANITLVDLVNKKKIQKQRMISKGHSTPFDQWECCGWPVMTICEGKIVYAKNKKIIIAEIISNKNIAKDTYQIVFKADSSWIKPGKFINIKIQNKFLRRPMSVLKIDENKFSCVYKVIGDGTKILSLAQPKEKLDLLIDLGNNYNLIDSKDILIIAGGCGIGSIYDLIKIYANKKNKPYVVVGFKTKSEVFFYEEIKKLTTNVHFCTEDGTFDEKGNIIDVIKKYNLQNHYYYVCGSNGLLKAVYNHCKQGQLSLECRMGCGYGVCMGCSILTKSGSKRVCVEGPIFESKELIW